MKNRVFYGIEPHINNYNAKDFSRGDYEGCMLFQTKKGTPVVVSRSKSMDIWQVQYGLSSVFFGTKAEALAFCKGKFFDADGQVV